MSIVICMNDFFFFPNTGDVVYCIVNHLEEAVYMQSSFFVYTFWWK